MADAVSEKKGNRFTYALVGVAGLGVVFIGVPILTPKYQPATVAQVNGISIEQHDFNRMVSHLQQRLTNIPSKEVRELALQQIINETLLRQHALQSGYLASRQDLYTAVKAQFGDNETYEKWLKSQRITAQNYEAGLYHDLTVSQYYQLLGKTVFIGDELQNAFYRLFSQQRDVTLFTLPLAEKIASVKTTPEVLRAYYEENRARYMSDETVSVRYVILDAAHLAGNAEISEQELAAARAAMVNDDRRDGQYIIFDDKAVAEQTAAALAQGERSFADIVAAIEKKELAGQSGLFDLHKKGEGPSEKADEVLFSLQKTGDTSALFDTEYGAMLVQLGKVVAADLDEAALHSKLLAEKNQERYTHLANEAFDTVVRGGTIDDIAALAKSAPQQLSQITAHTAQPDWLTKAELQNVLFGADAMATGKLGTPIELDETRSLFYEVDARVLPKELPYEQVETQVTRDYRTDEAKKALRITADTLATQLVAGDDLDTQTLGESAKAVYQKIGEFKVPEKMDNAIFQQVMQQHEKVAQLEAANGDLVVSRIDAVYDGSVDVVPKEAVDLFNQQMVLTYQTDAMRGYTDWLRQRANIKTNQSLLKDEEDL